MPKTSVIERGRPPAALRESAGTSSAESGHPTSTLTAGESTSGATIASLPLRLREDKPQRSFTASSPVIKWERFGYFAHELPPLFMRHWKEIALNQDEVPLDPNWDRYFEYD